ncbi:MAG: hypothetical protein V1875_03425 [Candidatus Altiarchaeota archaeon]
MLKIFQRSRPLIVHLGNVGEIGDPSTIPDIFPCRETFRQARADLKCDFLGIDLKEFHVHPENANWRQIQADFIEGLETGVKDNGADGIDAQMAVTYPGIDRKKLFDVIRRKLKPGKQFTFSVREEYTDSIQQELLAAGFSQGNITIEPFEEAEYSRTQATQRAKAEGVNLIDVIAKK